MPGPFALLRDFLPVFSNIRATARAGIFVAFALALLGGHAISASKRPAAAAALAISAFLFEARIAPIPTPSQASVIDSRQQILGVDQWLKEQPKGLIIAELPARSAADYTRPAFHDSIYMVRSTRHWQRLVNGFAGAEPPLIQRFRAAAPSFPSAESLAVLDEAGVRYVVVHLRGYGSNQRERLVSEIEAAHLRLREAARFSDDTRRDLDIVYELRPPGANETSPSPGRN